MRRHAIALFLLASLCRVTSAAENPPNVLVVLTDDQGWGDLSGHGNTNLATPNIDSLAADGALFERFYVCPVCSPTRAEFLTGRYHPRGGVRGVSTGGERLDLDEHTIAQTFKAAGYATAAFGKWHNGLQHPYHPNARGFDEFYGFCSGHWGQYFDPELEHNNKLVRGKGFIIDDLTDHALAFIENNRERPFVCYLPYNTPHSPMQVPDRFWKKFADVDLKLRHQGANREDVDHTRAALAMCENINWNVGRLLAKLDELNLAERTIVVYFSDNGPNGWRWNGGMRGRKGSTDEGGVRVPLFVRWPGHIRPGTRVGQISGAIDLLPTLADLAGIEVAAEQPLDGVSLEPLLTGSAADWPDRRLFSHWNGRVSVRTQQYRLDDAGRLYDMEADPGQTMDVGAEHPDLRNTLRASVAKWRKDVLAGLGRDDRPFTVGYSPTTFLPARDGVPHGNVQRSARAPNCSYFTNWTSPDDRITWDIKVSEDGRYEAAVYYTCAADDVGSTVELTFGDSRTSAKVTDPHDPPLVGEEHDRVSRGGESYVKDFKPLSLGVLPLKAGRGQLTLQAPKVAGRQVMDVRYVVLTRLTDS
ncbi:MAG: arylsulfatase [Planctomycetes bacterium]|nr:arylsulfatase [Planctomycetota bacterium]